MATALRLFSVRAHCSAGILLALALLAVPTAEAQGTATLLLPDALRGTQSAMITVADNLGRPVLIRTLPAGPAETLDLPLANLAPGIYTVLAHTAAGRVAKRLAVE